MHENWFVLVTDLKQTRLPLSLFSVRISAQLTSALLISASIFQIWSTLAYVHVVVLKQRSDQESRNLNLFTQAY